MLVNFTRTILQGRNESKRLQNKEAQGITRYESFACLEVRKTAALGGRTTRLAADWKPGSRLSPHHAAFTGKSTVGFMRSSFSVVLLSRRLYAQSQKAICCAKPSPSPTISLIKFVILLIKLNNLHISNLPVGVSVIDFQPAEKT